MERRTYRVYYEDTDAGGVVYHSNYLKFCERARSDHFYERGSSPQRGDRHFVIVSMSAKFKAPARLGDMLEVTMQPIRMNKASVELHQEIYCEGRLLFEMDGTFALTNAQGRPVKLTDEDRAYFN